MNALGKLATALCCASMTVAFAQTTFNQSVRLVEVYATVFDHTGRAIDGLMRNQFEIRDDGKPREIQVFEPTTSAIECALLLDTTGSMKDTIPVLRNAARELIDDLRPTDAVGVYSFTEQLSELQEMTADKAASRRALIRLRAGGRTALFDAVSQLALLLEKKPGKKVIVVLTDGGDNASILNRESAAQRARRAGIPVFAVAEGDALQDQAAAALLRKLAEETGGHMYKAPRAKDLERIFTEISRDLQNGYLLAFSPLEEENTTAWHDLQVVVKDTPKPVRVRARTGYFAP